MIEPGRLLARDVASMLLDIVPDAPCQDDTLACTLRAVDCMVPATIMLSACVAVGFLLAISLSVVVASVQRSHAPLGVAKRLLSGPVHTDGAWVRLVEDEHGRRVVEVLHGVNWRPAARDVSHFRLDVPVTMTSRS